MASESERFLLNGSWVEADTSFPMLNRAFRFGDGCFETLRIRYGRLLFLEDHLQRLASGMSALGFAGNADEWRSKARHFLEMALEGVVDQPHARLRMQVFRAGEGAYTPESDETHWVVEIKPLVQDTYLADTALVITDFPDFSLAPTPWSGLKLCNALPYVLAARYARREGFDEGLIWNGESVAEASSSNVFIIKEQQLITPPLSSGCLSGVMRKYLLAHASTCGLDPVEKKISANELLEADGMLLTNVIQGIRWVKKYREREYPVASAWKTRMESILIRA